MGNEGSQPVKFGESLENDIKVSWKRLTADYGPSSRDGHCACSVGNRCFVFGGVKQNEDGQVEETNQMFAFDSESCSWNKLSCSGDIPFARTTSTMSAVGKTIYLFGGLSSNKGWLDDVYSFNTENNVWKKLETTGSGPSPRDKLASATIGDKIYIFGGFGPQEELEEEEVEEFDEEGEDEADVPEDQDGCEFGWFNDLFVFNTVDLSWSNPMQMNLLAPTPRAAHAMCSVGKHLVIFGGKDAQSRRNDLHIFDTESRKWLEGLTTHVSGRQPEPRSFHTLTAVGGSRLVLLGGRGLQNNHYNDVHIFDIERRQWLQPTIEGDTFPARGCHIAAVAGDSLVVFGGSSDFSEETMQCLKYYNDVFAIKTEEILGGKCTDPALVSTNTNVAQSPSTVSTASTSSATVEDDDEPKAKRRKSEES